jgi:hypothetical protein
MTDQKQWIRDLALDFRLGGREQAEVAVAMREIAAEADKIAAAFERFARAEAGAPPVLCE